MHCSRLSSPVVWTLEAIAVLEEAREEGVAAIGGADDVAEAD